MELIVSVLVPATARISQLSPIQHVQLPHTDSIETVTLNANTHIHRLVEHVSVFPRIWSIRKIQA
jgi:hypothetical protein